MEEVAPASPEVGACGSPGAATGAKRGAKSSGQLGLSNLRQSASQCSQIQQLGGEVEQQARSAARSRWRRPPRPARRGSRRGPGARSRRPGRATRRRRCSARSRSCTELAEGDGGAGHAISRLRLARPDQAEAAEHLVRRGRRAAPGSSRACSSPPGLPRARPSTATSVSQPRISDAGVVRGHGPRLAARVLEHLRCGVAAAQLLDPGALDVEGRRRGAPAARGAAERREASTTLSRAPGTRSRSRARPTRRSPSRGPC